ASFELIHETRIARARVRSVVIAAVADALRADVPKSSLVRRINDHINAMVRAAELEPDAPLVSEVIEWIVEGYPDDLVLEKTAAGRPTPARGHDIIPIHLMRQVRAS
ncbi:MAG TPA: hypothetical protein VGN65_13795, partial [Casimicrobiaceae bacterium]